MQVHLCGWVLSLAAVLLGSRSLLFSKTKIEIHSWCHLALLCLVELKCLRGIRRQLDAAPDHKARLWEAAGGLSFYKVLCVLRMLLTRALL